jgi:ATP-dependent helicase/nuclease subunit A
VSAPRRNRPLGPDPAADPVALATAVQRDAASPAASVVLRAAAGAGKTKVLVDRFVRLCLAGSRPKAILAVTFTRKAAVEIKDRLLQQARLYASLPEAELVERLQELLGREPTAAERLRAARLHAEVLEDLAGLQIGTIHAFCQRILGRMAAELGLDPSFRVLEEEEELWAEALDRLEREAAADPRDRVALAGLAAAPDAARRELTRLRHDRVHLERWLDRVRREHGAEPDTPADLLTARRALFRQELSAELRGLLFAETPLAGSAEPDVQDLLPPLRDAIAQLAGSGLDGVLAAEPELTTGLQKQAAELREGLARVMVGLENLTRAATADPAAAPQQEALLEDLRRLLLIGTGQLRKLNGKKDTAAARQAAWAGAAGPVLDLLRLADRVALYRFNSELLRFGLRALDFYAELKRRDRCVDFQDLEQLAWALLRSPAGLAVQYRFDEAVDHLLVDEFQDTNRNQWEILRPFAEEFLAGESARGVQRTVFLVGDVKQSIYGFRGAEPALFGEVALWLERQAGAPVLSLPTNFRSLPAVVESVGRLMTASPLAELLPPGEAAAARQVAARREATGEVTILPVRRAAEGGSADHLAASTAVRIVRYLLRHGRVWEEGSPLSCGDILVLCRNRTHIAIYEQAFRQAGIPIVPAGRGLLARGREVKDLLLLLRWLSFPGDDAALAGVLRAPIFRVGEATLQRALARRDADPERNLWHVLQRHGESLGLAVEVELLGSWLRRSPFLSCHDLLRWIFRTGQLPERYGAALGEQARYNLLRLHDLALTPVRGEAPTLRDFAEQIQRAGNTAAEEEATPPERGSGRVRLMTVHGAKGLEAPVVLLVDAAAPLREDTDRLVLAPPHPDGPLLYGVRRRHLQDPEAAVRAGSPPVADLLRAAGERERRQQRREEADILYVAMTRARDALYVVGAEPARKGGRESYQDWLEAAAASDLARSERAAGGGPSAAPPYALADPAWLAEGAAEATVGPALAGTVNAEGSCRAWEPPPLPPLIQLVQPSAHEETMRAAAESGEEDGGSGGGNVSEGGGEDAAAGVAAAGRARSEALAHGEAVHLWLQVAAEQGELPADSKPQDPRAQEAWEEARRVHMECTSGELAWIFHPERKGGTGYAEVPILHRLPPPEGAGAAPERRVVGVIDRLVVFPGRAEIVDYKSDRNAVTAEGRVRLLERYRPQLAAYRAAIAALYPEREVRAHLLLTVPEGPQGAARLLTLPAGADSLSPEL